MSNLLGLTNNADTLQRTLNPTSRDKQTVIAFLFDHTLSLRHGYQPTWTMYPRANAVCWPAYPSTKWNGLKFASYSFMGFHPHVSLTSSFISLLLVLSSFSFTPLNKPLLRIEPIVHHRSDINVFSTLSKFKCIICPDKASSKFADWNTDTRIKHKLIPRWKRSREFKKCHHRHSGPGSMNFD